MHGAGSGGAGADWPGVGHQVVRPEWEVLVQGGCQWISQLGRGQYGTVHLVRHEGADVVAKVVFLDHLRERDRALALQEMEVLKRLQHPNIVQHYASWHHRATGGPVHREALVTLMEYCAGGDLRQWLDNVAERQEYLAEDSVLNLFAQMLRGIQYVHRHKVLHRDLKTSNMLLDGEHRVVKIGDFGIARVLDNTAAVAVTMLGTPYYMSPEVCKGETYRDKSDMWALGCVLYEMCVLRHAFESQSLLGLVYCIVSECYRPIPADRYSPAIADLVAQLLAKGADERPTAECALSAAVLQPYTPAPADAAGGPPELEPAGSAAGGGVPGGGAVDGGGAGSPPEPPAIEVLPSGPPDDSPSASAARNVPPPPPRAPPYGDGSDPLPPPSPMHRETLAMAETDSTRMSTFFPGNSFVESAVPPREPSPQPSTLSSLPSPPSLRRPVPPPGSPSRGVAAAAAPTGSPGKSASGVAAAPSPTGPASSPGKRFAGGPAALAAGPWAEKNHEAQVLLARVRGTLLRRPRSRGNWVQAFARHDTTGAGRLDAAVFAAFLGSLSLGLSRREVQLVTECLSEPRGSSGSVSLVAFSEAVEHATPLDERFGEKWALEAAAALTRSSRHGLSAFATADAAEVLAGIPHGLAHGSLQESQQKFLMWLPKASDGAVDWLAAEEWRAAGAEVP